MYLLLAAQAAVILNGKAVRLILDPRHQPERLGMRIDRQLHILKINAPCPVIIVLHHAADRDIDPQRIQHLKGDVYLPSSAVHHDQVRKTAEASHFITHTLLVEFSSLLQAVGKPPRQHLFHTGIIIRPLNCLYLKFTVITALWLSLLINDHGTY